MAATLTRAELQALAKQNGVKANLKNTEIEEALIEKGVLPAKKKTGLAVRDVNVARVPTQKPVKSKSQSKDVHEDPENAPPTASTTNPPPPTALPPLPPKALSVEQPSVAQTESEHQLPPLAQDVESSSSRRRSARIARSSTDSSASSASTKSADQTFVETENRAKIERRRSSRLSNETKATSGDVKAANDEQSVAAKETENICANLKEQSKEESTSSKQEEAIKQEISSPPPVKIPAKRPALLQVAPVPLILPPTPDKVRQQMDQHISEHKSQLERLIRQYQNAAAALGDLPALLQKQKELLEILDRTRDENKRLKETLADS